MTDPGRGIAEIRGHALPAERKKYVCRVAAEHHTLQDPLVATAGYEAEKLAVQRMSDFDPVIPSGYQTPLWRELYFLSHSERGFFSGSNVLSVALLLVCVVS